MELQGQTVSIGHDPNQKWYYLDSQRATKLTLIKIWDSEDDVAKCKLFLFFLRVTDRLMLKGMTIDSQLAEHSRMPALCVP